MSTDVNTVRSVCPRVSTEQRASSANAYSNLRRSGTVLAAKMMLTINCIFSLLLLECVNAASNSTERANRDVPIKYPGPVQSVDADRYKLTEETNQADIPEECRDLDYCTIKPKHYPEEDIRNLFNNRRLSVSPPELQLDAVIGNRQGDPDEEDNCATAVTFEPLYIVKQDNKWQTVVQAPGLRYEQKFRFEKCLTPDKPCFNTATFPRLFRTKCVQKYSKWQVQTLDANKMPVKNEVNIPSCCACKYYSYTDDNLS